ncbi:MAG: udp-glucose 4-epimerase, partial [Verrucomicrobiota bacterium]
NLGSDLEHQIGDVARLVKELTQSKSAIVHLPALTEGDMTRRQPDITKMRAILGRELTPLRVGIQKILKCRFNFVPTA